MIINAKFKNECGCGCKRTINVGELVEWSKGRKAIKAECYREKMRSTGNPIDDTFLNGACDIAYIFHN